MLMGVLDTHTHTHTHTHANVTLEQQAKLFMEGSVNNTGNEKEPIT